VGWGPGLVLSLSKPERQTISRNGFPGCGNKQDLEGILCGWAVSVYRGTAVKFLHQQHPVMVVHLYRSISALLISTDQPTYLCLMRSLRFLYWRRPYKDAGGRSFGTNKSVYGSFSN